MILTPGHGSLPSGHATEAFTVAYVLWKLVSPTEPQPKSVDWAEQLMRQAARVAINRTVAGVHFPVDSAAGQLLGLTLGEYFVHRATNAAAYDAWQFDGTFYVNNADFNWRLLYDTQNDQRTDPSPDFAVPLDTQPAVAQADLLNQLWQWAQAEWP